VLRVFLTHNPEDRHAYYGRALPELRSIADVVLNPTDRDLTTAELIGEAATCDVIVSHRSAPGPAELFDGLPQLLAFLRCAVDTSDIDVDAAGRNGILVARADKSFVASTAELALALMLDLARNVTESTIDYRNGKQPEQRAGSQLSGSTAGIVGYGDIGSHLAGMLRALGLAVLVHDPHATVSDPGIEQVDLPELLRRSDWVLPLAAAIPQTVGLIGAPELALMRTGASLVNVSRGELLDEEAVAAALDSGRLAGLAMDVGSAPDQRPSPLLASRPRVVATPHLGGLTPQNADAQAASSVQQVLAITSGQMPPRSINSEHATRLRAFWRHETSHKKGRLR